MKKAVAFLIILGTLFNVCAIVSNLKTKSELETWEGELRDWDNELRNWEDELSVFGLEFVNEEF